MRSSFECDVKLDVNCNMMSDCWSTVTCWLFLPQYKHLTNIIYSHTLSVLLCLCK